MRRRGGASGWGWLVLLLMPAALAAAEPELAHGDGRWLVLGRLPPLLGDEKVERQLTSGLTTTFLFRAKAAGLGGETLGAARVEVRYELWDEVFHLRWWGGDGRPTEAVVESREELDRWWSELELRFIDAERAGRVGGEVRITLEVVPFSRAEEVDTRRWFEESVRRAELGGEGSSTSVDDGDETGLFGLLIATSIRRQPLTTYRFRVTRPGDP